MKQSLVLRHLASDEGLLSSLIFQYFVVRDILGIQRKKKNIKSEQMVIKLYKCEREKH